MGRKAKKPTKHEVEAVMFDVKTTLQKLDEPAAKELAGVTFSVLIDFAPLEIVGALLIETRNRFPQFFIEKGGSNAV